MGKKFYTKLAGVTFDNRQTVISYLKIDEQLYAERETDNPYDSNAVAIHNFWGNKLGYLSKNVAVEMARVIDNGGRIDVAVSSVTGEHDDFYGVNICIEVFEQKMPQSDAFDEIFTRSHIDKINRSSQDIISTSWCNNTKIDH